MYKKIILIICGLLFIGGMAASVYIEGNLMDYSVYYARHLPAGKDRHPASILILENVEGLEYFDKQKDPNYEFDFDGVPTMMTDNASLTRYYSGLDFSIKSGDSYKGYTFNNKEILIGYEKGDKYYSDKNSKELKSINEDDVWEEIDEFLLPYEKSEPKPKINLQWYFNMRYEKRFK